MDCFFNTDNWHFEKWQNFGIKNISKKSWRQSFWKIAILGNIYQHLTGNSHPALFAGSHCLPRKNLLVNVTS